MAANSLPFRVWAVDVSEYDAVSVKNVVEEFLPENEWQMVLRFLRPIDQIRESRYSLVAGKMTFADTKSRRTGREASNSAGTVKRAWLPMGRHSHSDDTRTPAFSCTPVAQLRL